MPVVYTKQSLPGKLLRIIRDRVRGLVSLGNVTTSIGPAVEDTWQRPCPVLASRRYLRLLHNLSWPFRARHSPLLVSVVPILLSAWRITLQISSKTIAERWSGRWQRFCQRATLCRGKRAGHATMRTYIFSDLPVRLVPNAKDKVCVPESRGAEFLRTRQCAMPTGLPA